MKLTTEDRYAAMKGRSERGSEGNSQMSCDEDWRACSAPRKKMPRKCSHAATKVDSKEDNDGNVKSIGPWLQVLLWLLNMDVKAPLS